MNPPPREEAVPEKSFTNASTEPLTTFDANRKTSHPITSSESTFSDAYVKLRPGAKYTLKFASHKRYLAPDWNFTSVSEEVNSDADIGCDILSLVSNELTSYLSSHVQHRHEAMTECGILPDDGEAWLELDSVQHSVIQEHAALNFKYCDNLLRYLIVTHVQDKSTMSISSLPEIFSEYMDYAPGPWREAAFINVLMRYIVPRLIETESIINNNALMPTTPSPASKSGVLEYDYGNTPSSIDTASRSRIPIPPTMPERSITGEDDSASVSQGRGSELGGWEGTGSVADGIDGLDFNDELTDTASLISFNHQMTRAEQQKLAGKLKRTLHVINRLKAENAMLKESLEEAKTNDMAMLRDKWRGAQQDLATIRKRNTEMKDRVQLLEAQLFAALNPKKLATSAAADTDSVASSQTRDSKLGAKRQELGTLEHELHIVTDDVQDGISVSDSSSVSSKQSSQRNIARRAKYIRHAAREERDKNANIMAQYSSMETADAQAQLAQSQKLIAAHESRIRDMQAIIDAFKVAVDIPDAEPSSQSLSALPSGATLGQLLKALPPMVTRDYRKLIEKAALEQVQYAKDVDRKTIEALLQENAQLTAKLPPEQLSAVPPQPQDSIVNGTDTSVGGADVQPVVAGTQATGISRKATASPLTFGPFALLFSCMVGFFLTLLTHWLKPNVARG